MAFELGDTVIHWNFGMGQIIRMDEKTFSGQSTRCYVVRVRDLEIWVPAADNGSGSLRLPIPGKKFKQLFSILQSPAEELPENRLQRKAQLSETMRDGNPQSFCQVIRDLTNYGRIKKLSESDKALLDQARTRLLNEWAFSLSIEVEQAEKKLDELLPH